MPRSPDDLDRLIGRNIRGYRLGRGLTQAELASAIGVTFQQVQKYENGRSRIAASRLAFVAEAPGVPVASFFCSHEE